MEISLTKVDDIIDFLNYLDTTDQLKEYLESLTGRVSVPETQIIPFLSYKTSQNTDVVEVNNNVNSEDDFVIPEKPEYLIKSNTKWEESDHEVLVNNIKLNSSPPTIAKQLKRSPSAIIKRAYRIENYSYINNKWVKNPSVYDNPKPSIKEITL